jgi:hypothetical protein
MLHHFLWWLAEAVSKSVEIEKSVKISVLQVVVKLNNWCGGCSARTISLCAWAHQNHGGHGRSVCVLVPGGMTCPFDCFSEA